MSKETKSRIISTAVFVTAAFVFGFLMSGCGSIEEVPVTDDAKPGTSTGGTPTTMTGTGGTMMPAPTSDGSTSETKPPTDGNPSMLTKDEVIAQLKVVPQRVIFVIGNPQDFQGAKYGYESFYFPIGKKCINSTGNNTSAIWLNGKWQPSRRSVPQPSGIPTTIDNPIYIQKIATSDEIAADKVAMTNPAYPSTMSPLTIELWMMQHKDTMQADIEKVNASQSNLTCTDPS